MPGTDLLSLGRLGGFAAVLLAGCGGPSTFMAGSVTLDGRPLAKGSILLIPADGKGQTAGDGIVDGRYRLRASPGRMRVQIRSPKLGGKMVRDPGDPAGSSMVERVEEAIPARYNEATELEVTVAPGANRQDFNLHTAAH